MIIYCFLKKVWERLLYKKVFLAFFNKKTIINKYITKIFKNSVTLVLLFLYINIYFLCNYKNIKKGGINNIFQQIVIRHKCLKVLKYYSKNIKIFNEFKLII